MSALPQNSLDQSLVSQFHPLYRKSEEKHEGKVIIILVQSCGS